MIFGLKSDASCFGNGDGEDLGSSLQIREVSASSRGEQLGGNAAQFDKKVFRKAPVFHFQYAVSCQCNLVIRRVWWSGGGLKHVEVPGDGRVL